MYVYDIRHRASGTRRRVVCPMPFPTILSNSHRNSSGFLWYSVRNSDGGAFERGRLLEVISLSAALEGRKPAWKAALEGVIACSGYSLSDGRPHRQSIVPIQRTLPAFQKQTCNTEPIGPAHLRTAYVQPRARASSKNAASSLITPIAGHESALLHLKPFAIVIIK